MNGQRAAPDRAKLRIAGLAGSLRPTSSSRAALKVALDGAADAAPKLPDGFTDTFTSRYIDTKEKP